MKCLSFLVLFGTGVLYAQSISIVAPVNKTTIGGVQYVLKCTVRSISNLATVEYDIEGESIAVVPAAVQNECPSYQWNTFELPNGSHVIHAVAHDALNNVIATSEDQSFAVTNTKTCSDGNGTMNATILVTPGTSITSNWSGYQSITYAKSGSECPNAESITKWTLSVDGKNPGTATSFSGGSVSFDTREFFNGQHLVTIVAYDSVSNCTNCDIIGSWQRLVTFSNTSSNLVPVEFRSSAAALTLTTTGSTNNCNGGSSCAITGTEYASDNSTTSRSTPLLFNPDSLGVISISSNTIRASSAGVERVYALDPWYSSTTLATGGGDGNEIYDSSAPGGQFFTWEGRSNGPSGGQNPEYGWCVNVTSSTGGWKSGLFVAIAGGVFGSGLSLIGPLPSTAPANFGLSLTGGHGTVGPCREFWVTVSAITTNVPHFARNGSIRTSYDANASVVSLSLFSSGLSGQFSTANWAAQSVAAGWNVIEVGIGCQPGTTSLRLGTLPLGPGFTCSGTASTQTQWHNDLANIASLLQTDAQTNHYYLRLIGTSWTNSLFTYVGSGQLGFTYSPTAFQDASQIYGALNVCTISPTQPCWGAVHSMSMNDEVDGQYGNVALPGGTFGSSVKCGQIGGTCGPTQVVASNRTCTASWAGWGINASYKFVIQGATSAGFNTNYNTYATFTTGTPTTFVFACPSVTNGTYNSSTDPSMSFNIFADGWGSSSDYLHYNAFATYIGQANAASPTRPRMAFPPRGIGSYSARQNWLKDPRVSDYAETYYPSDTSDQGAFNTNLQIFRTYQGRTEFWQYSLQDALQDSVPWCAQAQVTQSDYALAGGSLSVSSFTGDIITVSVSDHGFRNVVPGITRLTLSGMSNSADNGHYMVRSFPTANAIQVVKAPASGGGSHTIVFDNSDVRTGVTLTDAGNNFPLAGNINGCWLTDIGHTFTASGVRGTLWYSTASNPCQTGRNQYWAFYQVPSGSSTGGTVAVQPDNYFHLGVTPGTQMLGPRYSIASQMVPFHLGASCLRGYAPSIDPDWVDSVTKIPYATISYSSSFQVFNPANADQAGHIQAGTNPATELGVQSVATWWAQAMPNLMMQRFACYTLGNRLASPDYGLGFLASALSGTCGNILFVTNFWDSVQSRTIALSPYLVTEKPVWKYYCAPISGCSLTQLPPGTASDTVAFDSAATVWYIFARSASDLSRPVISVRLADVSNAAKVIVRYAYTQFTLLPDQILALPFVADCGTGTCALPVDRQIGTVYFQVQYLDANGRILATGALETM